MLNITLLEEPHFRCSLETSVGSPLRLRNSWLVTYAVRYALLRAVHRRLLCRGVSLKIPLGPDWIHSSDMMWGGGEPGGAASAATSEDDAIAMVTMSPKGRTRCFMRGDSY